MAYFAELAEPFPIGDPGSISPSLRVLSMLYTKKPYTLKGM